MRPFLCSLALLAILGCGRTVTTTHQPSGSVLKITEVQDYSTRRVVKIEIDSFSNAVTVGSHSYIPLGLRGDPHTHHKAILDILDEFEKLHPHWEFTGWHIEKYSDGHNLDPFTFGIWIDHRPRKFAAAKE